MKEFDGKIPRSERLSLSETLTQVGRALLNASGSGVQGSTGMQSNYDYIKAGLSSAEDFANDLSE